MEKLFLSRVIKRLMVIFDVVKFYVVLNIEFITGLNSLNIYRNAPASKARHLDS